MRRLRIAFFATISLVMSINCPRPANSAQNRFVRGNANGDRTVDIGDAIFSLNYLFNRGRAPGCLKAADADGNGAVDIGDAITVLNFLFAAGPRPASPFPDCGIEATPTTLSCKTASYCFPQRGIDYKVTSGGTTSFYKDGNWQRTLGRGINYMLVNPATGDIFKTYDPNTDKWVDKYSSYDVTAWQERWNLIYSLRKIPSNVIILMGSADDAYRIFRDPPLVDEIEKLGSTSIRHYRPRDSWAMAAITGRGRVLDEMRKEYMGGRAVATVRNRHAPETSLIDQGDTLGTAQKITPNSKTFGYMEGDDIDVFQVTTAKMGLLRFETDAQGDNTSAVLYDSDGKVIAADDDSGNFNNFEIIRLLASGTYYLEVTNADTKPVSYILACTFREEQDLGMVESPLGSVPLKSDKPVTFTWRPGNDVYLYKLCITSERGEDLIRAKSKYKYTSDGSQTSLTFGNLIFPGGVRPSRIYVRLYSIGKDRWWMPHVDKVYTTAP